MLSRANTKQNIVMVYAPSDNPMHSGIKRERESFATDSPLTLHRTLKQIQEMPKVNCQLFSEKNYILMHIAMYSIQK